MTGSKNRLTAMSDALKQYLELYGQTGATLREHSCAPLNALRDAAADMLRDARLPRPESDNYENCDLEAMLAPDYGINIRGVRAHANPNNTFRCDVPVTGKSPLVCMNDNILLPDTMPRLPEGVFVGSMKRAAEVCPEVLEQYYGQAADLSNPVVALDTMLVRDGLLVYVPGGVTLNEPLQLVNILASVQPMMAVRRVLVVLGANAEARMLVCDHTQTDNVDLLALQTVEIFLGEGARFDYYDLEESSQRTGRISALYLRQQRDSRAMVNGMTLFNGTTRNEYYCRLDGEGADCRLYGMAISDNRRRVSTYSRIEHAVPHCHSDELFKYSADGEARCSFTGRIVVAPGAVKTEAYQACRNLLASNTARIQARPELEIYNDDVKCSHGCAIGQLDPMQVFYMRTRGIPEAQAHLLLRQAFMADVINPIAIPGLRDRLHMLVEKRFAGATAACSSCRQCK